MTHTHGAVREGDAWAPQRPGCPECQDSADRGLFLWTPAPPVPFDVFKIINADRAGSLAQALDLYRSEKAAHDKLKALVAECLADVESKLSGEYMPSAAALWTALAPLWMTVPEGERW